MDFIAVAIFVVYR